MPEKSITEKPSDEVARNPNTVAGQAVGDYKLDRCIAHGRLSEVWHAHRADDGLRRPLALKISSVPESESHHLPRTERAREILARISHPNLVRLFDANRENGKAFFVLEWVDGITLLEYCARKNLNLEARVQLFMQAVNAVQFAHTHLLVHGELRPSNILVNDEGVVKLLDYGLSIPTDLESHGQSGLSPMAYASPERLRGEPLTTSSDIYCLGAVLYTLITGLPPYPSFQAQSSPLSLSHQRAIVLNEVPIAPSQSPMSVNFAKSVGLSYRQLQPRLADGLDAVVLAAMARDPNERYDTARTFADDLHAWLSGLPVSVHPPTQWYRARKFVTRNRGRVALGLTGLAAIVGSAGVAAWQSQLARSNARATSEVKQFLVDTLSAFSARKAGGLSAQASRQTSAEQLVKHASNQLQSSGTLAPQVRFELLGVLGDLTHELQMNEDSIRLREERIALSTKPGEAANDYLALIDTYYQAGLSTLVNATLLRAETYLNTLPEAKKNQFSARLALRQGRQFAFRGAHGDAMPILENAAKSLKALTPAHEEWLEAQSLYLASLRLTKPDEAIAGYKQLIGTVDEMYGSDAPLVIPVVKAYTLSLARQRRVDEALAMFARMESLNKKHPNFDPVSKYEMLFEKGSMLRTEGKLELARAHMRDALEGFEKMGLADHPAQPLITRQALAELDSVDWNFAQSDARFLEVDRVAQKAGATLNISFIRGSRALNMMYQGQHAQARALFNESRALRANSFPADHASFAVIEGRSIHNEALAGNIDNALQRYAALKILRVPAHHALLSEAMFTASHALLIGQKWETYLADSDAMLEQARGVQRKILIHLGRSKAHVGLREFENSKKSLEQAYALANEVGDGLPQPLRAQLALQEVLTLRASGAKPTVLAKALDQFKTQRALLKGESAEFIHEAAKL